MQKNQILNFHFILLLKIVNLLSDFFQKLWTACARWKNSFFGFFFLDFFIVFEPNNGNMLWPIGIFLFGMKVPIWTTLLFVCLYRPWILHPVWIIHPVLGFIRFSVKPKVLGVLTHLLPMVLMVTSGLGEGTYLLFLRRWSSLTPHQL